MRSGTNDALSFSPDGNRAGVVRAAAAPIKAERGYFITVKYDSIATHDRSGRAACGRPGTAELGPAVHDLGKSRSAGFTLLELVIVIAIIAMIAALAIPALLNSRMAANEASAISSLRTLSTVNQQYRVRFQTCPPGLTDLQAAGYTDGALPVDSKSGYTFSYTGTQYTYTCNADPVEPGTTGYNYFFVDETGVIRYNNDTQAVSSDGAIGGT